MKILILSQIFDPEATPKGIVFAEALHSQGHEVEVLTTFPNYPGGVVYPGFKQSVYVQDTMRGIRVHRVPIYPSHDRSATRRFLSYFSFALTALLIGPFRINRPDVIYVYHPPGTISLPALGLRLLFRSRIVLDIQDLWPDSLLSTGMVRRPWVLKLVGWWLLFFYRRCDSIVVLSPGLKTKLIERGVRSSKIAVIYNWCDEQCFLGLSRNFQFRRNLGIADSEFVVLYAGTMGLAQGLSSVLEAAAILEKAGTPTKFIFIGGGVERDRLEKEAKEKYGSVIFLPKIAIEEVGAALASADALLVHLKDDPLFEITIPSKTQAYLAAGIPLLMGVRGDAANLIRASRGGEVFEPENAQSLTDAIHRLREISPENRAQMGRRGRTFYQENLSLAAGTKRFIQVFSGEPTSTSVSAKVEELPGEQKALNR